MKRIPSFFLLFVILLPLRSVCQKNEQINLFGINEQEKNRSGIFQPLAGSDDLGRLLPLNEEVGNLKKNRNVGIFYFLWQGDVASKTSENKWDLSKIIPNHPEVLEKGDHENWGSRERGRYYFWGEPIYGYYRGDDYWVHLRNMQLLADAQVDFLVIDATNALIYEKQSQELMKAIRSIQKQGLNPPKLVYYTNTESGKTMQKIYDTYYRQGAPIRHPETWYYLNGKPLIVGRTNEAKDKEYYSFFTFRESQWPNEPSQENGWPWIDFVRPQRVYKNLKGEREIINVSVSQHPNAAAGMGGSAFYGNEDNWGRSFRNNQVGNSKTDIFWGYNFQEQWDYALEQNAPFIFITGWNEWIAGRWTSTDNNPNHSYFCDQASPEFSRDIEPTYTANLKDNYYMQMVANIRKYKGVNPVPLAENPKKIVTFSDWEDITSFYLDYVGETEQRNHPGAESNPKKIYTNSTGRNDFYILKVSRDDKNLYFYAETAKEITSDIDSAWMRLHINSDRNAKTGWMGYDFRTDKGATLQKYSNKQWTQIGKIKMKKDGKRLFYIIPISFLNIESKNLNFEFKWSDNMQDENDPLDWYINGDTAPGGRFNFVYKTDYHS